MKLVELKCKNCGAMLKTNLKTDTIICNYCHTEFKIDNEVKHIQYDNMNDSGYEFEMGRIRAQKEEQRRVQDEQELLRIRQNEKERQRIEEEKLKEKKKRNLKWWILGWIFFFPAPITILIWKSKFKKSVKILLTFLLYGIIFVLGNTK